MKHPNFDDVTIDNQLKQNITFDILIEDIKSTIELLNFFENFMIKIFISDKKTKILFYFKKHHFNYLNFLLYCFLSRRKISLMYYKVKLQIEEINHLFEKTIEEEYISITIQKLQEKFLFSVKELNIEKYSDILKDLPEILKTNLEQEKIIINTNYTPSFSSISICLKYFKSILEKGLILCQKCFFNFQENNLIDLLHLLCQVQIIHSIIQFSYSIRHDDILNIPESELIWKELKSKIETIIIFSRISVKKKMKNVIDNVVLANASVSKGFEWVESLRYFGIGIYMAYFYFNKRKAILQWKKFFINPNAEAARTVWNLMDTRLLQFFFQLLLPKIKYRKILYLKRTYFELTKESVLELIKQCNNTNRFVYNKRFLGKKFVERVTLANDKCIFYFEFRKLRILKLDKWNKFGLFGLSERNYTRNSLIIHIHGGGFVSMSSNSHENYLRKWVNQLHVPLISIDYGLAPENTYPIGLDDCWQAYIWIVNHAESEFNIKIDKIILVGDSAGGNLVLGVTFLSILNNVRPPSALFLMYPALKFYDNYFTPSLLMCINDVVLPYHFLKFCLHAYSPNYYNSNDFFYNPINAPSNILKKLPYTRIIGGSSDPLRDDFLRFTKILLDNDVDCRYIEFKYFPHGFLNYDTPFLMPDIGKANELICNEIERFINII